jgi:hypothetical protein
VVQHDHTTRVGNDERLDVARHRHEHVVGDRTTIVGGNELRQVQGGRTLEVGGDAGTVVRGRSREDIAGDRTVAVGGEHRQTIVGSERRALGGDIEEHVAGSSKGSVGGSSQTVIGRPDRSSRMDLVVFGDANATVSKAVTLTVEHGFTITCGGTTLTISPDGVQVVAPKITLSALEEGTFESESAKLIVAKDATLIGAKVSAESAGAELLLDAGASLMGATVKLGGGAGANSALRRKTTPNDPLRPKKKVRLKMTPEAGPIAGRAYELRLDDGTTLPGATASDGMIDHDVPAETTHADLVFSDGEEHELLFTPLPPVDTIDGAQLRLHRLGLHIGAVSGVLDQPTVSTLRAFQVRSGIEETGELDPPTQSAIRAAYGS